MKFIYSLISFLMLILLTCCMELDITSKTSICAAGRLAIDGLMDYRDWNKGIGMLTTPYYWWHAGSAYGGVLEHAFICEDDTWTQVLLESMVAQTGKNYDYIPANQSTTEGNDDQGFWGLLAMHAAERNFTNPKDEKIPDWLALTQAVYNTMWSRWDNLHCGGGLRWQIFTWNSGYEYKNTISNGCLFHIAARLARFTRNDTYVETAETVYNWLIYSGFVNMSDSIGARVYDGANIDGDCSKIIRIEWSYNIALLLSGSAYLYNYTEDQIWLQRTLHFLKGVTVFFRNGIMYERACQDSNTCNHDQRSFRSVLSRAMGLTALLVPETKNIIVPLLETSAQAAALSCTGGIDGHTCGMNWEKGEWDGIYGLGEQMAALEIFNSLLVHNGAEPMNLEYEGVAVGDIEAGVKSDSTNLNHHPLSINGKDKTSAGIITAFTITILVFGSGWMIV